MIIESFLKFNNKQKPLTDEVKAISEKERLNEVIQEYLLNHPYQVYYYPDENSIKTLQLYKLTWYENKDTTFGFMMFFQDHKGKQGEHLSVSFYKDSRKGCKEIVATTGIRSAWGHLKTDIIGYIHKALRAAGIKLADNVVTSLSKVDKLQHIQHFEVFKMTSELKYIN